MPGYLFKYKRVDEQYYTVSLFGVELGDVYYVPEAWSCARWFIAGGARVHTSGGVNGASRKLAGYGGTRDMAAYHLAVCQSAKVLQCVST